MRAKLSARTILHPAAPMAIGACSRELPQPKLRPPTTIGYSLSIWFSLTKRVGYSESGNPQCAYDPNFSYCSGFVGTRFRYCAGIIWSVSMLSRTTKTGPLKTDCMGNKLKSGVPNFNGKCVLQTGLANPKLKSRTEFKSKTAKPASPSRNLPGPKLRVNLCCCHPKGIGWLGTNDEIALFRI